MKLLKKFSRICLIAIIGFGFSLYSGPAEAQILKKIGQKIEKSVERRLERKVDQGVEKGLDKVEGGVDQTARDAVSPKNKNEKKSKEIKETTSGSSSPSVLIPESFHDDTPYSEEEAKLARSNDGLILVAADCDDFAWFKQGTLMEYQIKGVDTKEDLVTRMQVESLRNDGNKRIATIQASSSDGAEMEIDYICAGNRIYFDLSNMLKKQMEQVGAQGADVKFSFEGGLTSFPKNMYPGMELEDAVFRMVANAGVSDFIVTSYLTDRKVEKRENVTTPAGTFNCIKVVGKRTTRMNVLGMDRVAGKPNVEELWIAPKVGVVKSVSKDDKGKIETVQELITYKP